MSALGSLAMTRHHPVTPSFVPTLLTRSDYHTGTAEVSCLPRRDRFDQLLRQGVERASRLQHRLAVCCIELHALQPIELAHGEACAERLLASIAQRLQSALKLGDVLARVGRRSIALMLTDLTDEAALQTAQHQLAVVLAAPFCLGTLTLSLAASVGVSLFPDDDDDAEHLLRHAEQAMGLALQGDPPVCLRYDAAGARYARLQQQASERLRSALAQGELLLYYQPKVCLRSQTVLGAEALLRWQDPQRGLLAPAAFLSELVDGPLTVELGDWVMSEALAQMARWRQTGLEIAVSVNVTASQLLRPGFVASLRAQLASDPAQRAGMLELELLESSAVGDIVQLEQVIGACRQLGVSVALDDFGTGHSTLGYLRHLSADSLKIDQSFVRNMLADAGDLAIVSSVIALAAAFHRDVIAEGVESPAQGQRLLELGCSRVQGYGIALPMPAAALPDWIRRWPAPEWRAIAPD